VGAKSGCEGGSVGGVGQHVGGGVVEGVKREGDHGGGGRKD